MIDLLSSVETEYGFAAFDSKGQRVNPQLVIRVFFKELSSELPWLPAAEGGWFLGNGARLYWDVGVHPEYAAPECSGHPRQLVAHIRAGHEIVARVVRRMTRNRGIARVQVWSGNIDYVSQMSWGCHENYLTRRSAASLAPSILPHLVSRVIYGGAGGWSLINPGQFSLSPRLELFQLRESEGTMDARGIINTRHEPHTSRRHRLHLICRDSLTSQFADLLSIGMTRLIVALADLRLSPARRLALDAEIPALQAFCNDTTCRVKVPTNAGALTAIEIQRRYLEQIDAHADKLPPWSKEIAELCSTVLDQLAVDPKGLSGKLEWPTKLDVFESSSARNREDLLVGDVLLTDLQQPLLREFYQRAGSEIVSAAEVEAAIADGPETTRAGVRGEVVKKLSGREDVRCGWAGIRTRDCRLDLDEPFETQERWCRVG